MATVSSLFLSEIAGFPPCKLCWYQRIFMYPQVIVLGVGYLLNDLKARLMAIILSGIGAAIAIYHILVQFFPASFRCSDEVAMDAVTKSHLAKREARHNPPKNDGGAEPIQATE